MPARSAFVVWEPVGRSRKLDSSGDVPPAGQGRTRIAETVQDVVVDLQAAGVKGTSLVSEVGVDGKAHRVNFAFCGVLAGVPRPYSPNHWRSQ
jgi:hypothetical protein